VKYAFTQLAKNDAFQHINRKKFKHMLHITINFNTNLKCMHYR